MATYDTCEETSDKETEMSQLEEWLLMLVQGWASTRLSLPLLGGGIPGQWTIKSESS